MIRGGRGDSGSLKKRERVGDDTKKRSKDAARIQEDIE